MEPILFTITLIPPALALAAKFILRWDISWMEMGVQTLIGAALLCLVWFGGGSMVGMDREVWNGAVVSKEAVTFQCPTNTMNPCENGYSCNCYTVCTTTSDGKGGSSQSCTTHCDTCYRYPWERNWHVNTSLRRSPFLIDRVDAQGRNEPPRYAAVRVGDGVSNTHSYRNLVQASAGTLFRDSASIAERYADILPDYPIRIFDYYRIDRVVTPNVRLANEARWNAELSRTVGALGPTKHINAVIVFVDAPRDYAPALRYHWRGFKQNDAVMVVGVRGGTVQWAEVMSWSRNAAFDVELRAALQTYQGQPVAALQPRVVMAQFRDIAQRQFERRSMEEFEYLRGDIPPPAWLIFLAVALAIALGAGTSFLFHRYDLDEVVRDAIRR